MMRENRAEETYYDILKVDAKATIAEIVAAYHTAKNAFSHESMATYSLFSADEAEKILAKLDEAYHTLSNIEKKRDYDEQLKKRREEEGMPPQMTELEIKQKAQLLPNASDGAPKQQTPAALSEPQVPLPSYEAITGAVLREIRDKRALSLEDVSRITKIPTKFITAIETEDPKTLPARVYLQGFVKNLATLYRLDPKFAATSYLGHIDRLQQGGEAAAAG